MSVPVIINCRDRLGSLLLLVDFLERAGHDRIVFLDNDSAYPPLLDYLADTPHHVLRLGLNAGHLAPWTQQVFADLDITGRFVYTDPDVVPDESCPLDAVEYFGEILDAYPDLDKVGFGLAHRRSPATYLHKAKVERWEAQFWEQPLAPRLFRAAIDTTFALYRGPTPHRYEPAARTGYPYLARHLTWYLDDGALTSEERFYRERAREDVVNWSRKELPVWLGQAIEARGTDAPAGPESATQSRRRLVSPGAMTCSRRAAGRPSPFLLTRARTRRGREPGWHSWNDMSAEVELCDFVVALANVLRPGRLIETGIGQGFLTRRLKAALGADQLLICFESDDTWREALSTLRFFDREPAVLSSSESPSAAELSRAELTCLDSDLRHRLPEIERWWEAAAPGATLVVHDAGNGHSADTVHGQVRDTITRLGIPGFFLANPRGAFVGVKPFGARRQVTRRSSQPASSSSSVSCMALRSTKTFRYTRRPRLLYQSLRRPDR